MFTKSSHNPAFAGAGSPSLAASPLLPIDSPSRCRKLIGPRLVILFPSHHQELPMPPETRSPRPLDLESLIHPKEKVYFAICVLVSLVVYVALAMTILNGGPIAGT